MIEYWGCQVGSNPKSQKLEVLCFRLIKYIDGPRTIDPIVNSDQVLFTVFWIWIDPEWIFLFWGKNSFYFTFWFLIIFIQESSTGDNWRLTCHLFEKKQVITFCQTQGSWRLEDNAFLWTTKVNDQIFEYSSMSERKWILWIRFERIQLEKKSLK
jgi:hypothetical protein